MVIAADPRVDKEDSQTLTMHLASMKGKQPAIAVDTKKGYTKFEIGLLSPRKHTL
jgi:hypothetical protein